MKLFVCHTGNERRAKLRASAACLHVFDPKSRARCLLGVNLAVQVPCFARLCTPERANEYDSVCKSRASARIGTEQNLHNSFARYWPNRANVMESASKACTGLARALHGPCTCVCTGFCTLAARLFARRGPIAPLFAFIQAAPAGPAFLQGRGVVSRETGVCTGGLPSTALIYLSLHSQCGSVQRL